LSFFSQANQIISEHIKNIFVEGELIEDSVVRNFRTTAAKMGITPSTTEVIFSVYALPGKGSALGYY